MKELLLELFSEEIPPLMQAPAEEGFKSLLKEKLGAYDIEFEEVMAFASPRRITLYANGIPERTKEKRIRHKGPATDAPEKAITGFTNSLNVDYKDLETCTINGRSYYCYNSIVPAKNSRDLLAQVLPELISSYTWPKSMYWGSYNLKWIRPLKSILALLDDEVIDFNYGHLAAGNITRAHKYICDDKPLEVLDPSNYFDMLREYKVIPGFQERYDIIKTDIEQLAAKLGLRPEYSTELLKEVTGLVEYPKVLDGQFDRDFLSLPPEALASSMQGHQKFIPLYTAEGVLTEKFIFAANIEPEETAPLIYSNQRVLEARLADGKFFYEQDQEKGLDNMKPRTKSLLFHNSLGSLHDKSRRLMELAAYFYPDDEELSRAAELSYADLTSEVVGEFPELQGIMGYYYAKEAGLSERTAKLLANHYRPKGVSDSCPESYCYHIALLDKIDNLTGLIAAGEKATGSKDPYALRRSALGVIRIIIDKQLHINLGDYALKSVDLIFEQSDNSVLALSREETVQNVLKFLEERAKYYFKTSFNHKLIDSLLDLSTASDLLVIYQKLESLQNFLGSRAGADLVEAYKRAYNILEDNDITGKNNLENNNVNFRQTSEDNTKTVSMPAPELFEKKSEEKLFEAIREAREKIQNWLESDNYDKGLTALSNLHNSVNDFFEEVLINCQDKAIKDNRLSLLLELVKLFNMFANFRRIIK